MKKLHQIQ